jgi:ribosomal protein S18 acetylase RimI-like enzyme
MGRSLPDYAPYNRAEQAVPAKLSEQPELFFVAEEDGAVIGTIMAGYDGHRGWLYAVAVKATHRQRGAGAALVRTAEAALKARGCVKINWKPTPV